MTNTPKQDNNSSATLQNLHLRMLTNDVRINKMEIHRLIDYVEYLSEKLNHSINYHDYIAENLQKAIEINVNQEQTENEKPIQGKIKTFDEMEIQFLNEPGITKLPQ